MAFHFSKNQLLIVYLLITLAGLGYLFQPFLLSATIGALLAMLLSDLHSILITKISNFRLFRKHAIPISAGLVTLLLVGLLIIPFIVLLSVVISKVNVHDILMWKDQIISQLKNISWINPTIKARITNEIQNALISKTEQANFEKIASLILNSMQKLSGSTFELAMIVVFCFLFLWYSRLLSSFIQAINPLPEITLNVARQVTVTLQVVFVSMLGMAITQGITFAVLMLFYGYNALILGFAAGICSIVPVFGTALVWVPVAVSEFTSGRIINAIVIAVFGWLFMGIVIDNLLRIIMLKKISAALKIEKPINEFLLFFAIASGVIVFGFWGIIIGPALMTLFLTLSYVYINSKNI